MKRWVKILLGAATFLPILFLMASQVVGYRLCAVMQNGMTAQTINRIGTYTMPSVLLIGTLSWGLLIFYIRHVSRNEDIPDDRKRFWRTALCLGIFVAMPIYWYKFIWRKNGG